MVLRINRMLLLVGRPFQRNIGEVASQVVTCEVSWNVSGMSLPPMFRVSSDNLPHSPSPSRIFRDETARMHEVISLLPKWDGNAFIQGIGEHAAAPRRRLLCTPNGTNNRASILLTWNPYYTLQKWDQLYGSVGFLWERGRKREGGGEIKKKKTQKGATRRKCAWLTTDLSNAVANKKIIWAE